ncbi:MAG: amidohydrolase family protein, partial [Planctomycetota bacterium]
MLRSGGKLPLWVLLPVLIAFPAAFVQVSIAADEADLVLLNGRITTLDPAQPEVEAIAAVGSRIIALGRDEDMQALIGYDTYVIDLKKRRTVPGFIESHAHLLGLGTAAMRLDLVGTSSLEEIQEKVKLQADSMKPGQWILGRGWDQNDWERKTFPTFEELTEAAPKNPVFLTRIDGHAGWANRPAMERAGLDKDSK